MTEQELRDLAVRAMAGWKTLWLELYGSGEPMTVEECLAHVLSVLKHQKTQITELADENHRLQAQLMELEARVAIEPPEAHTAKQRRTRHGNLDNGGQGASNF
jgi:regulator of replication initiation timing